MNDAKKLLGNIIFNLVDNKVFFNYRGIPVVPSRVFYLLENSKWFEKAIDLSRKAIELEREEGAWAECIIERDPISETLAQEIFSILTANVDAAFKLGISRAAYTRVKECFDKGVTEGEAREELDELFETQSTSYIDDLGKAFKAIYAV